MRFNRFGFVVCLTLIAAAGGRPASAATLRVCASGCTYATLQPAIDAAAPGDTILLKAGETFVGPFVLRAKPASTSWITIRSDASDSLLPGDGVRLVPSGKPGANTSRTLLPRLIGQGGALKTTPVIRTAPGAHHYILKFLEIDGAANLGFETLIALGDDSSATNAHHIVIDRVYAHGHAYRGMKRGVSLNSQGSDILNSYISDIKAVNADSQAIAGYNGSGPFRIVNNYLEGAGENVLFGGSDPRVTNLVPSDIEIRGNHVYKPMAWRNAILAPPGAPRASASTSSGSLAAARHYFKVVALMSTDTRTAVSAASTEVSATVSSGKSASLTWTAVPGADKYRIYRGTSPGGQSRYLTTSSAVTSFTYTGTSESSGTPPSSGTKWTVKNLLELKNAQRVTIAGNIFENVWQAGQYGYALVLTPRNQNGGASWVRIRDVTITNNIVRHASGVLQLAGYDATHPSQQTRRVTLRNNLFSDIDPAKYGGSAKAYLIGEGPADIVIDRNTLIHTNSSVVWAYGAQTTGFVYTNNISKHGTYGIFGDNGRAGLYSINMYFPSSTVKYNVLAGGSASAYPTPNSFPTLAQWSASFVDLAGGDYRLVSTSPFFAAGQGGTIPGADIGAVYAAVNGGSTTTPPPTDTTPPPTTNVAPVARPGGPYTATPGVAVTVDGSASSDSDGTIAGYRWTWGDEIVVRAADVAAGDIVGTKWVRTQVSGAAGGWALRNPNANATKAAAAASDPSSRVDVRFYAAAGVPYQLWFRMRAEGDSWANDSMFVQFSNAVDANGNPVNRIGSSNAGIVILEEGNGAGVSGWGWNDTGYGSLAAPVYFEKSGIQTLRVQQREDGIMWDQVVLSAAKYAKSRPGAVRNDSTILSRPEATTAVASHVYPVAGSYPVVLRVTDNAGAVGSAATSVTVGVSSTTTSLAANAGGPYGGAVGQAIVFDGSASVAPSASYEWSFGDEVVLRASQLKVVGSRWRAVADASAAGGTAMENPNLDQAKITKATGSPASYIEARFKAAAGVPYRMWIRMRAAGDSYTNDSIFVQFSGTVSSAGAAVTRIGSTDALGVVLENGSGAGVQGWGWTDAGYGTLAAPIYFNQDGVQTMRIQQREDGIRIDQIVISAGDHYGAAPGAPTGDSTVVPAVEAGATSATATHTYRVAGVFPVTLTLRSGSTVASDATTVTIR